MARAMWVLMILAFLFSLAVLLPQMNQSDRKATGTQGLNKSR